MKLFSAYGAARALEVDRETITRAVRGLEPDGHERGQPRYRLARIVEVLSARKGRSSAPDDALQARFDQLDALDARVGTADTLDQRRKLARALFAKLVDVERAMRADGLRSGEDARLTGTRADEHTRVFLATLREPCGWSFEEMFDEFNSAAAAASVRSA